MDVGGVARSTRNGNEALADDYTAMIETALGCVVAALEACVAAADGAVAHGGGESGGVFAGRILRSAATLLGVVGGAHASPDVVHGSSIERLIVR